MSEDVQKGVPIGIVFEDVLAPVTVRGDVTHGIAEFDADGARHEGRRLAWL
ncbi:MAG: hypothetical protein JSU95_02980 [Betaproteobacteria bacterium]|nr:MAG: hypothetical protein JSU95_02980 [Betaproteobacteria bacterium]